MTDRRLKRFPVYLHDFEAFLKGGTVVLKPLPSDAAVLYGHWCPIHGAMLLTVQSASFDPAPLGASIPFTDNIPVIEAKP